MAAASTYAFQLHTVSLYLPQARAGAFALLAVRKDALMSASSIFLLCRRGQSASSANPLGGAQ